MTKMTLADWICRGGPRGSSPLSPPRTRVPVLISVPSILFRIATPQGLPHMTTLAVRQGGRFVGLGTGRYGRVLRRIQVRSAISAWKTRHGGAQHGARPAAGGGRWQLWSGVFLLPVLGHCRTFGTQAGPYCAGPRFGGAWPAIGQSHGRHPRHGNGGQVPWTGDGQ